MKDFWKFNDIIDKLDDLERTPLGSLIDDIELIRREVEALKDSVEEALKEANK